jgi:hypothetical protein
MRPMIRMLPTTRLTAAGMRLAVACLALALTSGCATGRAQPLGDGRYKVECPGGYHDWSACYAAASRHCAGAGYQIVGQVTAEGAAVGTRDWSQAGSEVSRSMEFRCN